MRADLLHVSRRWALCAEISNQERKLKQELLSLRGIVDVLYTLAKETNKQYCDQIITPPIEDEFL